MPDKPSEIGRTPPPGTPPSAGALFGLMVFVVIVVVGTLRMFGVK